MKLAQKGLSFATPSQARLSVEASNLIDLIDAFLAEKASCAPRTYTNYRNELKPFTEWWQGQQGRYAATLTPGVFDDFLTFMGQGHSDYMRFRTTKRIRQFLTWAHNKGAVGARVTELCPRQDEPEAADKYYPSVDDLGRLFAACQGDTRLRDAALIAFAISTGARRFEIAHAALADLVFDTSWVDLDTSHNDHGGYIRLRVTKGDAQGKGQGRISVFDSRAGLLLKAYLRSVGRMPGQAGSIFGMSDTTIHYIVRSLGERAGLGEIHPHAFRSALIDHWHDKNAAAGEAADIAMRLQVGHTLPRSNVSLRYIDTRNKAKLLRRLRQFHASPLESLVWDWSLWPVHIPVELALPKSFA
jgi:integrase